MNPRRLYRSADDRILAGVCGGVAAYFDVDPVIVRIIWFLSVFFTGSLTFWAYLIMIFVVPIEPAEWPPQSPWAPGGAPVGFSPAYAPPQGPSGAAPSGGESGAAGPGATAGPDAQPMGTTPASGPAPAQAAAPGGWSGDWWSQRRQERWQRRAERWQQRADGLEGRRERGPGLVFGLLLILVGGMLAWHQIDPRVDLGLSWPLVIIAFGVILVASSFRRHDRD